MSLDHFPTTAKLPILWMDDEPEPLSTICRLVEEEQLDLDIKRVDSIEAAEQALENSRQYALVVDCKMNPDDPSRDNGAEFLVKVNERFPCLPTFVYSGYLHEKRYQIPLKASNALILAERAGTHWTSPISDTPFLKDVRRYAAQYRVVASLKPERIEFSAFLENPAKYKMSVEAHWKKHKIWITKALQNKGWTWGVACGTKLVCGSENLLDYPDDTDLMDIGRRFNLIPFAYSNTFLPESNDAILWNVTIQEGDLYPTVRIRLNEEVLTEDFDTGAYQTHVCGALVQKGLLDFVRESGGIHLGKSYSYFTKKVFLSVISSSGEEKSVAVPVCVVQSWNESPFVAVNPKRKALLGRDLLRAIKVRITLCSNPGETEIEFL